ncbi:MAG: hypothetical protein LM590_01560 [Thermofilum sp.]|jgi:acyl carrier protein|nr:hypothetical protein [Thermofilum sp.]
MTTKTALRNRYKKNLRKAGIKREDNLLVVTLPNIQSKASLELLLEIEKEFRVKINHVHLGKDLPSELEDLASKRMQAETVLLKEDIKTYTQLKLKVLEEASPDQLVIMPLTAEELSIYFLEELIRGRIEGLTLEARNRTAYPLASTTIDELLAIYRPETLQPAILYTSKLLKLLTNVINPQALAKFYVQTYASSTTP